MTTTLNADRGPEARERLDWTDLPAAVPYLRRYLARRCRDDNDVEDAVQETLLRAALYRRRGNGPRRLVSWLCTIAANVAADLARSRLPALDNDDGEDRPPPSDLVCSPELEPAPDVEIENERVEHDLALAYLARAYRELTQADRTVLQVYYAGEGTSTDVAHRLDLPQPLVKIRLFRARRRLRRKVERVLAAERIRRIDSCPRPPREIREDFLRCRGSRPVEGP